MAERIPAPWLKFLKEVDRALDNPIEVHCLGGFALTVLQGLPRATGDVDLIEARPAGAAEQLIRIAGAGSDIARRHHLQFHVASVAEYPEAYESRLVDITPSSLRRLRLRAMEAHDVVLAKLARNSARDRADVEFLAGRGVLDPALLEARFESEMRPYLLDPERARVTLDLWLGAYLAGPVT